MAILFKLLKKICLLFLGTTILWVIIYRFIPVPVTWLMVQRAVERKVEGKTWKIDYRWVSLEDISRNMQKAVVAAEDQRFFDHYGFDFNAIERAYQKNKRGKKVRGGSTISQQTAKNVFLWPGRSWIRKGFEAYFTLLIEIFWSKRRIMEMYVNVIEMGDGIYGTEAAAQNFFKKSARKLTRNQASLIAAVLPNPRRWSPIRPNATVYHRQYLILYNMRKNRPLRY